MKNKIYALLNRNVRVGLFIIAILIVQFSFAGKPEAKTNRNVSATGFIQNKGQIIDQNNNPNPDVKYLYHGNGLNVQLKTNGFSYDTYTIERKPKKKTKGSLQMPDKFKTPDEDITYHFHRIDVNLIGANPNPTIINAGASEAYYNYFTTGTPEGGVSNVHSFQQVTYQNIYPNIDLQFICDVKKGFKYNFIVHPGGDYTQIKLQYNGADGIKLQDDEILISTSNGNVTENIPLSYLQENNEEVKVNYESTNQNEFCFIVKGNYNSANTLVIDPTPNLFWGTYYGGNLFENGLGIALDANNDVYITGYTGSASAIATIGAYQTTYGIGGADAFVAKFNSAGSSLLWGTYYGGTGLDYGYGIVLDASNNVYITGNTSSTLSIATGGAYQTTYGTNTDAFVAKFNSTGSSLLWGTYYGGTGNDYGYGIVLDASNNVYITGNTSSTLSIATGGAYQIIYGGVSDAFVTKFNSTGSSLLWGTYYGGAGTDYGYGIALDASNNVYITGYTQSSSSIGTLGAYQTTYGGVSDAFIANFNSTGSTLLWGTYYGGAGNEQSLAIALDASNNVYITGFNNSALSIATVGAYQTTFGGGSFDAFVAKFNSAGSSLLWGTYYGGTGDEAGYSIALDANSNVYVTGYTSSTLSIATGGAYQTTFGGGSRDIIVTKFNSTGSSLLWGTYYGGTGNDGGQGIVLDGINNVYIIGHTTSTLSIATGGAYQTTFGGSADAFVARFIGCAAAPPQPGAISGSILNCTGSVNTYTIASVAGAAYYSWSSPGWAGASTTNTISLTTGTASGNVSIVAINACGISLVQNLSVTVNQQPTVTVNSGSICSGNSFTIIPSGANTYTIQGGSAIVSPTINNSYTVTGTSTAGCVSSNTAISNVTVTINALPTIAVNSGSICSGNSFTIIPSGANTYTIQGGSAVVSPTANNSYTVTGTSTAGCVSSNTAISNVTVTISALPTIAVNSGSICPGNSFTIIPSGANTYTIQGGNSVVSPTINSSYTVTGTSTAGCISTSFATSNVTVYATPTISVVTTNTLLCVGETATLTASGALTYTWNPGGVGTNIIVSPLVNTTYTVTGTGVNGCINNTNIIQMVDPCTNITLVSHSASEIKIYPNPNLGHFKIEIDTEIKNGELILINAIGQIVFEQKITQGTNNIYAKGLANGLYNFILLQDHQQINCGRILIE